METSYKYNKVIHVIIIQISRQFSRSARSQLSSSVVDNGSAFLLFGGYNFDEEHKTLATSQLVIPATTEEEELTPTEFR